MKSGLTLYSIFFLECAQSQNVKCYNNLAVLLMLKDCGQDDIDNLDSPRNKEIVEYLLLAIEGGDTDAMINLASFYMSKGKPENAIKYYNLAYINGSANGAFSIAVANHFGLCGYSVDKSIAIDCYRKFFDLLKTEKESDSKALAPESQNCLNLILLLHELNYSLCDITKEYNKVKKPSVSLIYAYTVISNNLSNKAHNFLRHLSFWKTWRNTSLLLLLIIVFVLYIMALLTETMNYLPTHQKPLKNLNALLKQDVLIGPNGNNMYGLH